MAKKPKQLRNKPRKSFSTQTFTVVVLVLFVILILVGLGIFSLPSTNKTSSMPMDLTTIVQTIQERLGIWFSDVLCFCLLLRNSFWIY